MSEPRRWSRRLAAAILALGTSVLALCAAEAVLRKAGWRERTANFTLPGNHAAAFDHSGKFRLHPERYFTTGADYRLASHHAGLFATGAWPFRGRPAEPAPEGIVRVGVFGDSCVYGEGVPVSASLPEQIQRALAERGRGAEHVQVLNLGVPGYSTVQIRLCLEETLARFALDAAVFYPAAWNDQAPALGSNDLEILGQGREPWLARALPATKNALTHALTDREPRDFMDQKEQIAARMLEGRPRVESSDVAEQVERMLALCRSASVAALVVLPAHRTGTNEEFPRTAEDRETVRRVASAAGVPIVDAPVVLAESGADDEELFLDTVHPSPAAYAHIARAVSERLVELLPERTDASGALRITRVEPESFSSLGDERVTVVLAGWTSDEETVVTIGGAPLLDLVVESEDEVSGLALANGPGQLVVLVQTAAGCARASRPVELVAPTLAPAPDGAQLVLRSRPGDELRVMWSPRKRATPRWRPEGPQWVEDGFRSLFVERIRCGADAQVVLDPRDGTVEGDDVCLQPVVEVLSPEGWVLASYVGDAYRWRKSDG